MVIAEKINFISSGPFLKPGNNPMRHAGQFNFTGKKRILQNYLYGLKFCFPRKRVWLTKQKHINKHYTNMLLVKHPHGS